MTGNKPRSTLSFMKQKVQSPNQMNKNISLSLKQRKNNCCLPSRSSFSFRPPPFTAQPCEWNTKMFTQFVHHTFSFKDLDEQVAIYMAKNRQLKAVNLKGCPVVAEGLLAAIFITMHYSNILCCCPGIFLLYDKCLCYSHLGYDEAKHCHFGPA